MKKKIGDTVYVQRWDMSAILSLSDSPEFVIDEIDNNHPDYWEEDDDAEVRFLFDQTFTGEVADWIMNQDWIVDISDYEDVRWQVINDAMFQCAFDNTVTNTRSDRSDDDRRKADHKVTSLSRLVDWSRGMLSFDVPC